MSVLKLRLRMRILNTVSVGGDRAFLREEREGLYWLSCEGHADSVILLLWIHKARPASVKGSVC